MPSKDLELIPETEVEKADRLEEDRLREQFQKMGIPKGATLLHLDSAHPQATRVLSQLVGAKGRIILVVHADSSIESVRKRFSRLRNISYLQSSLTQLSLEDDSVEIALSRGSFSYIADTRKVLSEMLRVTKRGGRIIVGASDAPEFFHYPMPNYLEAQVKELSIKLEEANIWDPRLGRKLFSMFQELCLDEVKGDLVADYIFMGESNAFEMRLWSERLEQIQHLQDQGLFKLSFDLAAFRTELFTFLKNPVRFSYAPLMYVEGKKSL